MEIRRYVLAKGSDMQEFAKRIGTWQKTSKIFLLSDPCLLKEKINEPVNRCAKIYVRMDDYVNAINIVAGLARCSKSCEVIAVQKNPSESVRHKLAHIGIETCITEDEIPCISSETNRDKKNTQSEFRDINEDFANKNQLIRREIKNQSNQNSGTIDLEEPDDLLDFIRRPRIKKQEKAGIVVSIASGRGGVGKSSIVSTLAGIAHAWGLKVALLDFDLTCGNLFAYCGNMRVSDIGVICKNLESSNFKTLFEKDELEKRVQVLGPLDQPEQVETVVQNLANIIRQAANEADVVLIDTPSSWNEVMAVALQESDRVLCVTDERANAVSSYIRLQKFLNVLGIAKTRTVKLVNKGNDEGLDKHYLQKIGNIAEHAPAFYAPDMNIELAEVMSQGKALEFARDINPFTTALAKCLAHVLEAKGKLPAKEMVDVYLQEQSISQKLLNFIGRRKAS